MMRGHQIHRFDDRVHRPGAMAITMGSDFILILDWRWRV